jgi:hypothetical protein
MKNLTFKTFPKAEETMKGDDRVKRAYESFRGGFKYNTPEDWDSASNLVRDVARVGYAQGLLDGADKVSSKQALDIILANADFDGMDPNSITIGELRRALR